VYVWDGERSVSDRAQNMMARVAPFMLVLGVGLVMYLIRGTLTVPDALAMVVVLIAYQAGGVLSRTGSREPSIIAARVENGTPGMSTVGSAVGESVLEMFTSRSLDVSSVLRAMFEGARATGRPVATHIWSEDAPTGTMRLVESYGVLRPAAVPEAVDDTVQGHVLARGSSILESIADITDTSGSRKLWRYAFPLSVGEVRAVACVDLSGPPSPDAEALNILASAMHGALAGALAVRVADMRSELMRSLLETARELSRTLDPDQVLEMVLDNAMRITSAATGSIMLLDPDEGILTIRAARGLPIDVIRDTCVKTGEGIAGWVVATGKPLLIESLPKDTKGRSNDVRSAISTPLVDGDEVIGVLNVGAKVYPARFGREHMDSLEILGTQAAVAYRNALALDSTRDLYFSSLRTLALAMETKDPYGRGGTERIVELVVVLGAACDMSQEDLNALELAALFHDVGMAAAGSARLDYRRPLSTVERGLLKMHPAIAADILREAHSLQDVAPIVYHHHERFDGKGYIAGIAGDSIPIGARILAVVDAFVAMTSDRAYRGSMSVADALAELEENAGTQFDPQVVEVLLELIRQDPSLVKHSEC